MSNVAKINKINWIRIEPYLLSAIIIFGFLIRFYLIRILPVNLDEGNYIYDANLILDGKVPFRDFMGREPIYFYILAFFISLFGTDLIVSRGITLISSIGLIYLTYKIGKELYSNVIGLVGAFLFAFSPFIIDNNLIGNTNVLYLLIVTTSFYYLILAFKNNNNMYYLFFGLLLGASILTYRLSTIFLLTFPFLFVIVKRGEALKEIFTKAAIVYAGITLSLIPILVYLIAVTNFKWMTVAFGADKILIVYISFMPILILSFFFDKYIIKNYDRLSKFIGFLIIIGFFFYSCLYIGIPFSNKARIVYGIILENLYLLAPTFLFLIYYSERSLFKNKEVNELIAVSILYLSIFFLYLGITAKNYSSVIDLETSLIYTFIVLVGLLFLCLIYFIFIQEYMPDVPEKTKFSSMLLAYVFLSQFVFHFSYNQWLVAYFNFYTVIFSLMSAVILLRIYKWVESTNKKSVLKSINGKDKIVPIFFIILLIVSAFFTQIKYTTTPNPDRGWKLSTLKEVSNFISSNTEYDDEIFTAGTIFAVYAKRNLIFDISHPLLYIQPSGNAVKVPLLYDPYNFYPSISEIIDYLEKNQTKYIVADIRTTRMFLSNNYPSLRDYISKNYYIEKTIDNVKIYRRFNNISQQVYFSNFDSDIWKNDSYSFYGITRGTGFGGGDDTVLYPERTDELTYIRYRFNLSDSADSIMLSLTARLRDTRHNITVWVSPNNDTYTKIIEFTEVEKTSKQADITNYVSKNQTWVEIRFYRSGGKDASIPRILNFSIAAVKANNGIVQITPFKNEEHAILSKNVLNYNLTNLLAESSFEHYKNSDKPPIAWVFTSTNGGIAQIDDIGFDGNYSYRVNIKNATNGTSDMSQMIDINGSIYYRFSIAYKWSGSGNASVLMQWFDKDLEKINEDRVNLTLNSTWSIVSFERMIPINTKHGEIILRYITNKGDTGTVWFDNVKLLLASEDQL